MPAPNFFIIGAPKCGTTSLSEYFRSHPRVFMSTPKEPFYWSRDIAVDPDLGICFRTLDEYLALFAHARSDHLRIGEASTSYIWSETAVPDIMRFAPDSCLIAMVRNPIEIVQRLHHEEVFSFVEDQVDFETAWSLQSSRAQGRNLPERCFAPKKLQYRQIASLGRQVEALRQHVPREQLLIINYDDFASDTMAEYARVVEFLGLPQDSRSQFPRMNSSKRHRMQRLAKILLRPPSACAPIVQLLRGMIRKTPLKGVRSNLLKAMACSHQIAPLNPAFRETLVDAFCDDVHLLESLIGRDLSHWLNRADSASPTRYCQQQTADGVFP